jgi:glutamate--cysteine ligase
MIAGLEHFIDFQWGIERETHRISPDGNLSPALHPESLKEPSFTKDFAESQLELVTKPHGSIQDAVEELEKLTETARVAIGSEWLWPFSMPPLITDETAIRTARMGSGESARLAERYRAGLSARYGIARQLICGVHLNVSFGEKLLAELKARAPLSTEEALQNPDRDGYYLRLTRNLFDDMPSLVMLFGSTPFDVNVRAPDANFAYSVRNSPKGYARTEYRPFLELGSIAEHLAGIRRGMKTESVNFRKLGLIRDGKPVQLNGRVFQKEKEFYAPIRFKRTPMSGETAIGALERKGVEYIELRFFDVDPFASAGITENAVRLAHIFIVDGLAKASIPKANAALAETLDKADEAALSDPFKTQAENGHLANLLGRLASLAPLAREMGASYERTLETYRARYGNPGASPAATLAKDYDESGLEWSRYGANVARLNEKGDGYGITA